MFRMILLAFLRSLTLIALIAIAGIQAQDAATKLDGSEGGYHCKWSPDGKQIIFASAKTGEAKMYIVPSTGGDPVLVECGLSGDHHTGWSADSKNLVFDAYGHDGPPPRLWIIPAGGGKSERLLPDVVIAFQPALSPDGDWVAFVSLSSGNSNIWKARINGDSLTQVTTGSSSDHHPQWSPDGKYIVFASNRSGNWDIWKVDNNCGQLTRLTVAPELDDQPMVSPDGQWIAFMSARSGRRDIWLMPSGGGTASRFTYVGQNAWPSFCPDGKKLLWSSNRDGQAYIYVAEITGDWSPEGN